jgi:hypothetical protein
MTPIGPTWGIKKPSPKGQVKNYHHAFSAKRCQLPSFYLLGAWIALPKHSVLLISSGHVYFIVAMEAYVLVW